MEGGLASNYLLSDKEKMEITIEELHDRNMSVYNERLDKDY